MGGQHHARDLQEALEASRPYELLSEPLRHCVSLPAYRQHSVHFAAMRYHSYQRLPDYLRAGMTEQSYYKILVTHLQEKLQLYPYVHIRKVVQYTRETPLSYYTTMIAELLKAERSYDTLPNFTAVDVLNSVGIGRNQYLEVTKEVRSKLRWHINRQFVRTYLPSALLPSVTLPPFWGVFAVDIPAEAVKKAALRNDEAALHRHLLKLQTDKDGSNHSSNEGCCFACEFPHDSIHALYHKGFVCATFSVAPEDQIVVPPLERFVMNRTSDDPTEVLLYKVLVTADNRTSLSFLAQLLMLDEADICAAAQVHIRLGLAQLKTVHIPEEILDSMERVHNTWRGVVQELVSEASAALVTTGVASSSSLTAEVLGAEGNRSRGARANSRSHPPRRIALMYDASLTGFLMTNLSADPTFTQHAVTLFEVGKLSEEMIGSFIEKLEKVDLQKEHYLGDEAVKYMHTVQGLREVLKTLRRVVGQDKESGVDMLKVESMNELEPTTRYSVLGRNYWAYFVTSPVSYAPLIDVALNGVYGSTVSLMPSPWMTLYLYSKMGTGPPSLLLPVGARLAAWPPLLQDTEKSISRLRLQPLTMDAEVTYVEAATSIILVNEMTAMAPILVQRVEDVPLEREVEDIFLVELPMHTSVDVMVPFTASDAEAVALLRSAVMQRSQAAAVYFVGSDVKDEVVTLARFLDKLHLAVEVMHLEDSVGHLTFHVSLSEVSGEGVTAERAPSTPTMTLTDAVASPVSATALPHVKAALCYLLGSVHITDIGLGIPVTSPDCCAVMVRHLEALLGETRSEHHNNAMRELAADFGLFLSSYSPLTLVAREKMALQSTAVAGPSAQLHVRRLGADGNGGVPFPSAMILFDGERLSVVDEWDPLVELWQV
ncbi:hypothetical protein TraAM80_02248 [Trypanosoma rangeli]|uniref:Uncharacterized protein n=1 Tax=Trypanosoma rangeli TaxID=5698 RepID=A0A3R7KTC9_TRYRA|nr:uncharacterized protein TraAM80_02248 [Trypanosoma rangeli]RNF09301.1 hypothetical protein TraAM80_02248 [Trypanosoma rangeli]|eukprot:RNF09301.1 hypothetical protein TraAM80_02248 [Trypanosoma rangeli]